VGVPSIKRIGIHDVEFGEGVTIVEPVNLYGCRIGDGSLEWQLRQLENNQQEVTRFDEAGQITALYQTVDGQPHGEYTTFSADGQAKQTVTYQQGTLNGPARTFFNSGQVEHEFTYSNGEVDGIYRTYSSEGKLLSEYTFSAGQLN